MNILVIIVTYNGENWIEKCLNSLFKCELALKIIIFDNNSNDKTRDIIRKKYSNIEIIENNVNKGFGAANNLGLRLAIKKNFDYAFLLNQDCWIEEGCIKSLIRVAEKRTDFGILSPLHLSGSGNTLDYGFIDYIQKIKDNGLINDSILNHPLREVYELPFVNAAAWLIRKECLMTVGGFNPIFFHYGEDDNYCHRVKYHNWKIGIVPTAKTYHDREKRQYDTGWKNMWESDFIVYKNQLLVKYSNINEKNISLFYGVSAYFKKIIKELLKFNLYKTILNLKLLIFYLNKQKKINNNRIQSMIKQPSWIE